MITSEQTLLLSELRQKPIPEAILIELEARLQHRIHSMVLDAFNESGLSQKELAERLGWDTARVSRCLGTSSNWTLKTVSALLAAIGVDLDNPSYTSIAELERRLRGPVQVQKPIKTPANSLMEMTGASIRFQPDLNRNVSMKAKQPPSHSGAESFLSPSAQEAA
jgi:transcriptional regulator with XRE-family HTH domain